MDKLVYFLLLVILCAACVVITLLYVSIEMQQETKEKVKEISQYLMESDIYVETY